jgi:hypothetical protein
MCSESTRSFAGVVHASAKSFANHAHHTTSFGDLGVQAGHLPVVLEGDACGHRGTFLFHRGTALLLGNVVDEAYPVALKLRDFQ